MKKTILILLFVFMASLIFSQISSVSPKVKIFSSGNSQLLESYINSFIQGKFIIDIKYQILYQYWERADLYSVIIIYKDK